jgi:hypothetical protein
MKRNLIFSIAVALVMLASEIAWAADVSFSGQFRPRYNENSDSSDATSPDKFFDTRVRLNAKANVNANTEVFLQFQSTGQWGTNAQGTNRIQQNQAGAETNDVANEVGLHQAFLTLKNFYGVGVDAKIGRQEVVIDGHRLFGHTGWTQGAASADAIRLTHAGGNHTLSYVYMENKNVGDEALTTTGDDATHVFHANTQGVLGGNLSGYLVISDDRGSDQEDTTALGIENTWYTIGARQTGKMGGLDYRVEYYHQFGDGAVTANDFNGLTGIGATTYVDNLSDIDRDAHMFGVRVGKTFKNVKYSPTVTLWFDHLSGNDDDDVTNADWGGFNTLFDTGHKFYGLMDHYLSQNMLGTEGMGLEDIAVKVKMTPRAGWTAKADMHWFSTAVDMDGDNGTSVAANTNLVDATSQGNSLGSELDLTLVHKYDANTNIQVGWSHYWTTNTFALLNGAGSPADTTGVTNNQNSTWFYVQADTKF